MERRDREDTLFTVNDIFDFFALSRKLIESRIIEGLIMGKHAMNGMQQLAHDSAHSLQRCFPVGDQMLEEALHIWVMRFSAQGRQIQGTADIVIAGLGDAGTLVHAGTRLEVARIQPGRLDPLLMRQPGR